MKEYTISKALIDGILAYIEIYEFDSVQNKYSNILEMLEDKEHFMPTIYKHLIEIIKQDEFKLGKK
jgi:hypothetical protein